LGKNRDELWEFVIKVGHAKQLLKNGIQINEVVTIWPDLITVMHYSIVLKNMKALTIPVTLR
jgi:hypothetical protein